MPPENAALNAQDSELLRHAALGALAVRHPVAVATRGVVGAAEREVPFRVTMESADSALEFLKDKGLVKQEPDDFGATKWWTITAAGLLAVERGM